MRPSENGGFQLVEQSGEILLGETLGFQNLTIHHNTDIWRITGALDKAPSGMWPSGGAWLCRHLWERYLYTGDTEFLRSVYPILKGSGLFFDEIMVKEPVHNWLVVCPSNSPENVHSGSDGKATTKNLPLIWNNASRKWLLCR